MTQSAAQMSLWEALGADDLVATEIRESFLEFEDSTPFDRISPDSDISRVIWQKTLPATLTDSVPFPLAHAYLSELMPEMYGFHPGLDETIMFWMTDSVHDIINETYESMSPTTKALVSGTTTINEIAKGFFTPAMISKAETLVASEKRLSKKEIIRVLMEGQSVSLVGGLL